MSLPILSCVIAELGNVEAGNRCRHTGWSLRNFGLHQRGYDLRAGADDDAIGLRIAAVAGVARGIEEVGAVAVVQDGGAAVVAAVGVGLGEVQLAIHVDLRHRAIVADAYRIGGIDDLAVLEFETSMLSMPET